MATRKALWDYRDEFGDAFGRTYFRRFGPARLLQYRARHLPRRSDSRRRRRLPRGDRSRAPLRREPRRHRGQYRCGRAERVVGEAVRNSPIDRDAVVVTTKGGFLPFDGERPDDPAAYVRERFVEPGIVAPDDLANGAHAIAPDYLGGHSIARWIDSVSIRSTATTSTIRRRSW